ncbi:2'-5' RNA ligase family protein [Nocardia iowensis]|uniref:2'-5' RNA ligase family protein n=1 Tax=Nocardia iowensis TaxID=204891 RepID=A0ABX8RHG0_NOCIO|nr:2'-5' RNA ligase family protein [Nocardia iowensis]QXN88746.1 2'-5' RNA ligase family protein [Nocardia iowensis]
MTATSKRPFPFLGPASTSDAEAIRDNDWSAFQHLPTVYDHWSLKPWSPGQAGYYWYLTFSDPALVELASHCQTELAHDGLDPVPLDGLHLTMLNIGRTDDVTGHELARIADAGRVAVASVKPFRLSVGPLTGSRSALRFSVTPWDQLLDLHRRLRSATAQHRDGSRLAETAEFRPHLGVGYLNRRQDAQQLIKDVSELRELPPVTVRVHEIHLVELRRVNREYKWENRAVVALG